MQFFLLVIVLLNVFDMLSTLAWCRSSGVEQELNPIMRTLIAFDPCSAMIFKLTGLAFFIGAVICTARCNYRLAWRSTSLVLYTYVALLGWHIVGPWL